MKTVVKVFISLVIVALVMVPVIGCAGVEEPAEPTEEVAEPTEEVAEPTEEVTEPTEPVELTMEIVSVTDPVETGKYVKVKAKTAPGAECKLVMTLANGDVSGFPKDSVKTADSNGNVEWSWELFKYTPSGETKIEITATLGGKTATATTTFTAISEF